MQTFEIPAFVWFQSPGNWFLFSEPVRPVADACFIYKLSIENEDIEDCVSNGIVEILEKLKLLVCGCDYSRGNR